jgi:hypothetical protein
MANVNTNNLNEETKMTNAILEKLQQEIASAMKETLDNSKFSDLLAKYGLLEDGVVKIKLGINKNKILEGRTLGMDSQLIEALGEIPENEFVLLNCCICTSRLCCLPVGLCSCCN